MTLTIALVLGTSIGGIGVHVRELAAGLVARGNRVVVAGPADTGERFGFADVGADFRPVAITGSVDPARGVAVVRALRSAIGDADVVHAHGVRAGALTGVALARRDTPSVVTLHNAMLASGVRSRLLAGLEKLAVLRADVVLGASADLVERARTLGARDARFGPVPAPPLTAPTRDRAHVRAELGVCGASEDGTNTGSEGQILVLAVGRLAPQRIPEYQASNRGYLTVAVGCTGGQHRSVYIIDRLGALFAGDFANVTARHSGLPGAHHSHPTVPTAAASPTT